MSDFLETKRLILKPIDPSHLDDLFALRSDPEVMKYIGETGATQKSGIKTPKEEIELIKRRLKTAKEINNRGAL